MTNARACTGLLGRAPDAAGLERTLEVPLQIVVLNKCAARPAHSDEAEETPMFEVFREYRFEAAHRLPRLPEGHKWGRLHGHSFVVQLPVRGTLDAEKGWLVPPSCRARTHGTMHWFEGRA